MRDAIKILLVEDEPAVRDMLRQILDALPGYTLVAAVGTLAAARVASRRFKPDVLITDLGLPDGNGLALIQETRQALPDTRIAVISVLADEASVVSAIGAGAIGYLLKDDLPEDFLQFLSGMMDGHATLSPAVARHIVRLLQFGTLNAGPAPAKTPLTPREHDVHGARKPQRSRALRDLDRRAVRKQGEAVRHRQCRASGIIRSRRWPL